MPRPPRAPATSRHARRASPTAVGWKAPARLTTRPTGSATSPTRSASRWSTSPSSARRAAGTIGQPSATSRTALPHRAHWRSACPWRCASDARSAAGASSSKARPPSAATNAPSATRAPRPWRASVRTVPGSSSPVLGAGSADQPPQCGRWHGAGWTNVQLPDQAQHPHRSGGGAERCIVRRRGAVADRRTRLTRASNTCW